MKDNSNISFIVPAYNASNTLEEVVNSIFNGNFQDGDEIIIVNDASPDDTSAIAEHLAKERAPNISIITNTENKGCAASRNIGVTVAKNDLIFNLDSDNILAPGNIYKLKESLLNEQADVAAFGEYPSSYPLSRTLSC
jgi:glycosyltransferase involved in cell wall biosynthesis